MACKGKEVHTGFWWVCLRERGHLDDPGVDGKIIQKSIFKKWNGRSWTELISLKIGIESGLLLIR
jgi:hypothetical protein